MQQRRLVALYPLVAMLGGCLAGHMNKIMDSWQGHHYSELIMSWGPPQAVYDDGAGGRILVYTQQRQWTTPGHTTTTTTAQASVYDNMIWANAQSLPVRAATNLRLHRVAHVSDRPARTDLLVELEGLVARTLAL